jgi:hypothetical protein
VFKTISMCGSTMWASGVALLVCAAGGALAQPLQTTTIYAQGDPVPGLAGTFFGATPLDPNTLVSIDQANRLAFKAVISGAGVVAGNSSTLWTGRIGSLSLIAREGSNAAGLPVGVLWGEMGDVQIGNDGRIVWRSTLTGGGVSAANNEGFWTRDLAGNISTITLRGAAAPGGGAATVVFNDLVDDTLRVGNNNHIAFAGTLTGFGVSTANDTGLWGGPIGALQLIAREGDQAPSAPVGALFSSFTDSTTGLQSLVLSDVGRAVFFGNLAGGGLTASNNIGLYSLSFGAATPTPIIRLGDTAPTLPAAVLLTSISAASINSSGTVSFRANTSTPAGSGVTTTNNQAIWVGPPSGPLTIRARKGAAAPGTGAGVTMSDFPVTTNRPRLDDAGNLYVQATLTGTGVVTANNSALYRFDSAGTGLLVARKGDTPPGVPAGVVINSFDALSVAEGALTINIDLAGTGITSSNDTTVYSWTPGRGLRLLAREGANITIDRTDVQVPAASGIENLTAGSSGDGVESTTASNGFSTARLGLVSGTSRLVLFRATDYSCGPADVGSQGGQVGSDGQLNNDDFAVFITLFFQQNPAADVGVQGGLPGTDAQWNNDDFAAFITLFFQGCE